MCGICGVAGTGLITKDLEFFEQLMWVTGLRGSHSTGVFAYTPGGQFKKQRYLLHKRVQSAPSFIIQDRNSKIENSIIRTIYTELFMGHCRYATVGDVTAENAHPFDTGRYVGAHNGTLTDLKYNQKGVTDSQLMFEDMEKRGVSAVLQDLNLSSAYSISVFDKHKKTITLATNGKRPLTIAISRVRPVLYYASERSALEFIATRNDMVLDYYSLEPNKVYTVKLSDIKTRKDDIWDIEELQIKKSESLFYDCPSVDDDLLGSYCTSCGSVLYGRHLKEAQKIEYGGTNYYTCRECIHDAGSAVEAADKEVKVG